MSTSSPEESGLKRPQEDLNPYNESYDRDPDNFKIRKLSSEQESLASNEPQPAIDAMMLLKNLIMNHSGNNSMESDVLPLDLMKKCISILHNRQNETLNLAGHNNRQADCEEGEPSTSTRGDQDTSSSHEGGNFEDCYLKMRQKLNDNECRKNFYNYDKPTMFQKMLYSSELSPNQKLLEKQEDMLRRFSSFDECSANQCSKNLTREHYHCTQCERVIVRREEMVRHVKWHKKREESLQYGFMRFSPNDDCKNINCVHNGKQTHYHCLQLNCQKIYVSTSDVQMHANYHRKDAIIMQDGFQRYRATEDCGLNTCPFHCERTTHFHCRRPECYFTFKNKADIEKHKGHHQRNDNYAKDGFRKFIKYESCDFPNCKYSKIMNHIHCIRRGCDYVVHSSSQILSHKRKHDRRPLNSSPVIPGSDQICRDDEDFFFPLQTGASLEDVTEDFRKKISSVVINAMTLLRLNETDRDIVYIEITDPIGRELFAELHGSITISDELTCPKYNDCNTSHGHYHCIWPGCNQRTGPLFKYQSHWLSHAWTGAALRCGLMRCRSHLGCPISSLHHHCFFWPHCSHVLMGEVSMNHCQDVCEHLAINEFDSCDNNTKESAPIKRENIPPSQIRSKSLFQSFNYACATPRRRGRPPKHKRDVNVPHVNPNGIIICTDSLEQNLTREMFTQRKTMVPKDSPNYGVVFGIRMYEEGEQCIDDKCHFQQGLQEHYHCARPKCYLVSQSLVYINMHRKEFHGHLTIDEGFEHFDRTVDCRRRTCHNNRLSRHYHCVKSDCDYSFVRYSTMRQHGRKHEKEGDNSYEEERTSPSNTSNISMQDSYRRMREDLKFKITTMFPSLGTSSSAKSEHESSEDGPDPNPFMNILGLQPLSSIQSDTILESMIKNQTFTGSNEERGQEEASIIPEMLKNCFNNIIKNNENFPLPLTNPAKFIPEKLPLFGNK